MHHKNFLAALCALSLFTGSASADLITYVLQGTNLNNTGTTTPGSGFATGSFTVDTSDPYTPLAWDITVNSYINAQTPLIRNYSSVVNGDSAYAFNKNDNGGPGDALGFYNDVAFLWLRTNVNLDTFAATIPLGTTSSSVNPDGIGANEYSFTPADGEDQVGYFVTGVLVQASVPEIDPVGFGSVAALLAGALGLLERRRPQVA